MRENEENTNFSTSKNTRENVRWNVLVYTTSIQSNWKMRQRAEELNESQVWWMGFFRFKYNTIIIHHKSVSFNSVRRLNDSKTMVSIYHEENIQKKKSQIYCSKVYFFMLRLIFPGPRKLMKIVKFHQIHGMDGETEKRRY